MLNPIEEVIKDKKTSIRTLFATTHRQIILDISLLPIGRRQGARRNVLEECLVHSMRNISTLSIQSHIRHSMSFIPSAIRMADL